MKNVVLVFILAATFAGNAGCRYGLNLGPPGTIGMQRERAVIHDPFPSPDLGPEIVGGRPREFDRPLSQAKGLQVNPFARPNNRGGFVPPQTGF